MSNETYDDYLKIVEWSDKDQCYVGTAPPRPAGSGRRGRYTPLTLRRAIFP